MYLKNKIDSHGIWKSDPFIDTAGSLNYVPLGTYGISLFEFVAFWLDPMLSNELCHKKMENEILPQLIEHLKPFTENYPFVSEPGAVTFNREGEYLYIHMAQECPYTLEEELLRGLVWDFLKKPGFQNLYIHFTDDDYLLCKNENYLKAPKWIDPKNSCNRIWLNHNRCIAIPPSSSTEKGLTMVQAVSFLGRDPKSANFVLGAMTDYFEQESSKCIEKYVGEIVSIENVELSRPIATMFEKYPWMMSTSFFMSIGLDVSDSKVSESLTSDQNVKVTIGIQDWIKKSMERNGLTPATVLTEGFKYMLKFSTKLSEEFKKLEPFQEFDLSRDRLQKLLLSSGKLKNHVPEREYLPKGEKNPKDEEYSEYIQDKEKELMDDVKVFFENKDEIYEQIVDDEEYEEDYLDEEKVPLNKEEDSGDFFERGIREFYNDQQVTIDEDDFFEYYIRNELNVPESELELYMADLDSRGVKRRKGRPHPSTYNDDSDYTSDVEYTVVGSDIKDVEDVFSRLRT